MLPPSKSYGGSTDCFDRICRKCQKAPSRPRNPLPPQSHSEYVEDYLPPLSLPAARQPQYDAGYVKSYAPGDDDRPKPSAEKRRQIDKSFHVPRRAREFKNRCPQSAASIRDEGSQHCIKCRAAEPSDYGFLTSSGTHEVPSPAFDEILFASQPYFTLAIDKTAKWLFLLSVSVRAASVNPS